jgi:complement component 1 Q subcomponent-binding protein
MSGDSELEVNRMEAKLLGKVAGGKIPVPFNITNGIPPTFGGEAEPSWVRRLKNRSQNYIKSQYVVEVTE